MPSAMHVEPFPSGFFAAADLVAHNWIENLRATAGDRTESCLAQDFQRVADRHLKDSLGQMTNFDGGECLDVELRIECAESSQKLEIPIFLQGRMQPAYHVDLSDPQGECISHRANNFINCIFKRVGVAFLGGECTELTG